MGMYGLGVVVAPAVGPVLGGWLIEHFDWRLVFFINVPVAIVGAIAGLMTLTRFPPAPRAGSTSGLPHHRLRPVRDPAGLLRG